MKKTDLCLGFIINTLKAVLEIVSKRYHVSRHNNTVQWAAFNERFKALYLEHQILGNVKSVTPSTETKTTQLCFVPHLAKGSALREITLVSMDTILL